MNAITSLLKKAFVSAPAQSRYMGHNFRTYGTSFGTVEFEDFVAHARAFYDDAMHSDDSAYTVLKFEGGRTAIDFNGEVRGVYDKFGNPIAFFRPSYQQLGYSSKEEELEEFRAGNTLAFS